MRKLKIGSLFAGIGGFDLGLERTGGFETAWFCEIEDYPTKILNKNWPGVPVYPDVTQLKGDTVEPVDILTGGFPCQDISAAGRGAGIDGDRSGLWFEFARVIGELRPRYVIAENSPLLRSRGLNAVLGSLAALGYDAEWDCLPASAFGAPHQRDRIWVVAYPDSAHSQGDRGTQRDEAEISGPRFASEGREAVFAPSESTGEFYDPGSVRRGAEQPDLHGRERHTAGQGAEERGEVADSKREGLQGTAGPRFASEGREAVFAPSESTGEFGVWPPEPDLPRVAHGVPDRVDRIKCLGNALIPPIPEWIGHRILAWEGGEQ